MSERLSPTVWPVAKDGPAPARISVVIPSYRVRDKVLQVIAAIPQQVDRIYVVDDACPEETGAFVIQSCRDPRVTVLRHDRNRGVGGAVMSGYRAALADGTDVIVKIDGDGQMDPGLLFRFARPILAGEADYTKGNRFYHAHSLSAMPRIRLFGNAALSFMSKFSTGYWNIFDPTNGFTAISAYVAELLLQHRLSESYFFESDVLFRLNTIRAKVMDIPMEAKYEDEVSNLNVRRVFTEFLYKHVRNTVKRIVYTYFIRDTSVASLELALGIPLFLFGTAFGCWEWMRGHADGVAASAGTVMLAALPILVGIQFILAFINYDVANVPRLALTQFDSREPLRPG